MKKNFFLKNRPGIYINPAKEILFAILVSISSKAS